jgi:hypothetical protein
MGDNADNGGDYGYDQMQVYLCPSWALSLGYLGVASGAVLSNWGSAVSYFFLFYYLLGIGQFPPMQCCPLDNKMSNRMKHDNAMYFLIIHHSANFFLPLDL